MYRREKAFNQKLLDLREKKMDVVKTIVTLYHEHYLIHSLLHLSYNPPLKINIQMDPEEFPET